MARPAPSIDRTVALLNFLATRPDESFSLTELSRRVGIAKPTAHAMLAALTDAGYLLRHPADKTYALGPALVAVGAAAAKRELDLVAYARDGMQALADELGVEVVASAAVGEEIVMLARAGEPRPLGVRLDVGQRLPLVPPLGTVFVAWSPPDEIDRWLRRVGASATDADLERYRAALDAVRRRGYLVGLEPASGGVRPAAAEMVEDLGHQEYVLTELDGAAPYRPMHMAAPVFGPDGSVALALTLIGFRGQLRVEKVPEIGERLLDAARTVTKAIGGVDKHG
jgi:DNA-binding IclR family transcriptional regulator